MNQVPPSKTIDEAESLASVLVTEDLRALSLGGNCQGNTPLENLPPELRRYLISTLDLAELKSPGSCVSRISRAVSA